MNTLGFREFVVAGVAATTLASCQNIPNTPEVFVGQTIKVTNNLGNPNATVHLLSADGTPIPGGSIIQAAENNVSLDYNPLPQMIKVRIDAGNNQGVTTGAFPLLDGNTLNIVLDPKEVQLTHGTPGMMRYSYNTTPEQPAASSTPTVSASTVPTPTSPSTIQKPAHCPQVVTTDVKGLQAQTKSDIANIIKDKSAALKQLYSVDEILTRGALSISTISKDILTISATQKGSLTLNNCGSYPSPAIVTHQGKRIYVEETSSFGSVGNMTIDGDNIHIS